MLVHFLPLNINLCYSRQILFHCWRLSIVGWGEKFVMLTSILSRAQLYGQKAARGKFDPCLKHGRQVGSAETTCGLKPLVGASRHWSSAVIYVSAILRLGLFLPALFRGILNKYCPFLASVEIYCDYIRNCAYFWRAQSVEWFSFWQLRVSATKSFWQRSK